MKSSAAELSRHAHLVTILCSLILTLHWTSEARAVEGGFSPYLKGTADFMSGYIPPEPDAFIFNKIFYHFSGSADASVRSASAEFGVDATLGEGLVQGTYVTGATLFGGTYAFGAVLGYAKTDLSASLNAPVGGTPISQKDDGIADSIVTPIILGWHDGNLHMSAALPIYAPTGDYNLGHVSIGKNIWAFMPQFAVTWFDPTTGWDLSGVFTLVFSTKNTETDYQSGALFHLDWAVGKKIGKWELGVAGNIVEQISDDSGSGAILGGFRAESFGMGPAVKYDAMLFRRTLTVSAKWEHDLSATRTFKGNVLAGNLVLVF